MSASSTPPAPLERELLEAARRGDARAYDRLVEPHRAMLHAHCYRMLGSLQDAEDVMQEALLAAWQGISGFEGRSSLRTWLFTIATHACLRLVARRPRRLLPVEHGPAADPGHPLADPLEETLWVEPYPTDQRLIADQRATPETRYAQRESVELAFVAALQHLPATQRAVLILREVLGFSAAEVAASLDTTVPSVNSALQRARQALEGRLREPSQEASRRALGEEGLQRLVDRFIGAWERADVDAIVALLAEDATFTMPPLPAWFRGKGDIRRFIAERVFATPWHFRAAEACGQPAMAAYQWNADTGTYRLAALNVFSLRSGEIAGITAFLSPAVFAHFALPDEWCE